METVLHIKSADNPPTNPQTTFCGKAAKETIMTDFPGLQQSGDEIRRQFIAAQDDLLRWTNACERAGASSQSLKPLRKGVLDADDLELWMQKPLDELRMEGA
jgi:hypothetical protein